MPKNSCISPYPFFKLYEDKKVVIKKQEIVMKHFVYSLITLLQVGFLCNAAQVGFNKTGYVLTEGNANFFRYYEVTVDLQGRIIAVGRTNNPVDGLIACYLPNGILDRTFNGTGFINEEDDHNDSRIYYAVTVDSQGRIIAVGQTDALDGLIVRYLANGTLDTTFNGTGFINQEDNNNDSQVYLAVAIDLQGRIIAVGQTDANNGFNALIACYLPNGILDKTFNETGFINEEDNDNDSRIYYGVTVDSQGRIIAVGQTDPNKGLIVRYLADGTLDTTFNQTGFIKEGNTDFKVYYGVTVDSQGRIIVVGQTDANKGLIVRYLADGTLDTIFNQTGFIKEGGTDSNFYYRVSVDLQDRIIAVGQTDANRGLIVRYLANGTLDTTLNQTGFIKRETDFKIYNGVTIDSEGRIIAVGQTDANKGLIARFLSNGVLDAESNWNLQNFRESKNINKVSIGLLG